MGCFCFLRMASIINWRANSRDGKCPCMCSRRKTNCTAGMNRAERPLPRRRCTRYMNRAQSPPRSTVKFATLIIPKPARCAWCAYSGRTRSGKRFGRAICYWASCWRLSVRWPAGYISQWYTGFTRPSTTCWPYMERRIVWARPMNMAAFPAQWIACVAISPRWNSACAIATARRRKKRATACARCSRKRRRCRACTRCFRW